MQVTEARNSRLVPVLLAALLAIIALVYWPGIQGGFIFDDFSNIVDNGALHVTRAVWNDWLAAMLSSPATTIQRPLAMLTFAANHYFTGLDPMPMKLTNVAIHLLNTLLVFGLVRSLLRLAPGALDRSRSDWAALFAASCWALHPINLMAILFVVQRMESLCHTFVFAGLWLYVAGRGKQMASGSGWGLILAGLGVFTLLGVLVKESAALLPLYAFCIELTFFRFQGRDRQPNRGLMMLFVLLLAIPAILGVLWLLPKSLGPNAFLSREFSLGQRLLTEPRVVMDYLRWILVPDLGQLSLYHDDYPISSGPWSPPATLIGLIGVPVLAMVAWLCRIRRPVISLGLMWFLGAHVMTATFLPLELVFEHRNYFASLGICLVLADVLVLSPRGVLWRRSATLVSISFVIACAGITALRAHEWRSPATFSLAEATKHPTSPRATYYRGWILAQATNFDSESPLIQPAFDAFDQARGLPDSSILPDQGALILAARTDRPLQPAWWEHMQKRLREHPIGPQELGALGGMVTCALERHCQFPPDEMLATFGAALSQGDNPEVLNIYGNYALNVLQDPALALRAWREASSLNPREPQYQISVTKLLIALGRYEEAEAQIGHLRGSGRLGQYESAADALEARLQSHVKYGNRPDALK